MEKIINFLKRLFNMSGCQGCGGATRLPMGLQGSPGLNGRFGGYSAAWTYDDSGTTTPAARHLSVDNLAPQDVLFIYVNPINVTPADLTEFLASLENEGNFGKIRLFSEFNSAIFNYYEVTSVTLNAGIYEIGVEHIDGTGTLVLDDTVVLSFTPGGAAALTYAEQVVANSNDGNSTGTQTVDATSSGYSSAPAGQFITITKAGRYVVNVILLIVAGGGGMRIVNPNPFYQPNPGLPLFDPRNVLTAIPYQVIPNPDYQPVFANPDYDPVVDLLIINQHRIGWGVAVNDLIPGVAVPVPNFVQASPYLLIETLTGPSTVVRSAQRVLDLNVNDVVGWQVFDMDFLNPGAINSLGGVVNTILID